MVGDFMFLYRLVRRHHRRRPQSFVHNFSDFFQFWWDWWTWPVDYLIRFSSWPWPSIFKVKYGIHDILAKNGPIATQQTCQLNSKPQLWLSDLTWAMTLTLNRQSLIWKLLYLCQKCSDCHKTISKHIDWTLCFKYDHRIWPWPWPWLCIFKVKSQPKMVWLHTECTEGLNDHQVWSRPWPWKVRCKDLLLFGKFRCSNY